MVKNKHKVILSVAISVILLNACGEKKSASVEDYTWNQVATYSISTNSDGGETTATLEAPDYAAIVAELVRNNSGITITTDVLEKAIEKYPDKVKQYTFEISDENEDAVRQGFLNQISYEIIISGISSMESSYTEQWKVE